MLSLYIQLDYIFKNTNSTLYNNTFGVHWFNGASDAKIYQNKLSDRIKVLESIKYIDKIIYFNSTKGLEKLVEEYKPHVLIVGSDWKNKTVVGEQYAQHIRFFDRIEEYSTTKILEWKNQ